MTYTSPVQNFLLKIKTKEPPTLLAQLTSLFPPQIFSFLFFFFNLPNGTTIHSGTQSNLPNGITIYLGTQSTLSSHIQTSSTLYHLPVRHSLSVSLSPVMDTSLASILWTVALLPSTIQKQYGMNERFTSTFLS